MKIINKFTNDSVVDLSIKDTRGSLQILWRNGIMNLIFSTHHQLQGGELSWYSDGLRAGRPVFGSRQGHEDLSTPRRPDQLIYYRYRCSFPGDKAAGA
jgi:hypothetical protein